MAERSYRMPEVLGATARPRLGEAAERSNPKSKEQRLHRQRRPERSYSTLKVRRAAVIRYPSSR